MAHSQIRSVPTPASIPVKMSYSKIAAMPPPNHSIPQNTPRKDIRSPVSNSSYEGPISTKLVKVEQREVPQTQSVQMPVDHLRFPLEKLSLVHAPTDITFTEQNADSGDSYEEDRSQVSTSSLNKPHSFDTKSLASVTTFAMDDKESIRPDDSASVRAVDDDHTHPGLSRNSSFQHDLEQPARSHTRPLTSNVIIPGRRFPTLVNPPKFGNFSSLPISPVLECQDLNSQLPPVPTLSSDEPRDAVPVPGIPPDEKLIEALASVKDRLPLLQLEEKILWFVTSSVSDVLELPPQNGFTRLLTHRLADYYGLAHQNTEDNTSVRVSRSGLQNLPTPLAQLAKAVPIGSANGPNSAAVKIMRREQLGNRHSAGNSTAPSSSVPSKATSENGNEGRSEDGLTSPTESTPSRDKTKMTREEREAQYAAVRERIFGNMQESVPSEIISTGENSTDMSRSSSSSGKKKNRRNKQPKDDSFDPRSAFVQSYSPLQTQFQHSYGDHPMAGAYHTSPVPFDPSMYGTTPTQAFPGYDAGMPYANMPPYSPSMMQQYGVGDWQSMQTHNGYFMYPQGLPYQQNANGIMSPTQIMPAPLPDWYGAQYPQNMSNVPQMSPGALYPQHPVSDQRGGMQNDQFSRPFHRPHSTPSFHQPHQGNKGNKSLFNPQTRSFVPNNTEGRNGSRTARHQKQGRNSLGSYAQANGLNINGRPPKQEDSLKSRYGTPPSLPKKPPPPSEVKHVTEAEASSLTTESESSVHEVSSLASEAGVRPLVVNGGTAAA